MNFLIQNRKNSIVISPSELLDILEIVLTVLQNVTVFNVHGVTDFG